MLYQIDQTGASADEVFRQFWQGQDASDEHREFAERLVGGVIAGQIETDRLIGGAAEHWRLDRMAVVDRNVLRLAVCEMLNHPETPQAVVIDEAIEVAKRFGSADSGAFINGILDSIRQQIEH
jgi:N utilization substance protein B